MRRIILSIIEPGSYCKYILLFAALTWFSSAMAQSNSESGLPFITNYSAKTFNALPQAWSIQEDNRGVMYFGVQSYILEYDGQKWRKISLDVYSPSTVVRAMPKDKNGTIYYGAYGDLGYLGKDSLGQTKAISLLNLIPVANRNFLDIWSAYTTDNGVYFQSREYIFRINEKKEVKVWKPKTRFMYSFFINGDYYVHQQGLGLFKMVDDSLVFIPGSEFLGKERMQVMLPYPSGPGGEKQYLVGMFYSGLYIYNGKTFRPFSTHIDSILKSGVTLYKGIELPNGNYALSSTGVGLLIIDAEGNLIQKINRSVGLQDESVYAAYIDKRDNLWLALDNGISRVEIASPLTQFTLQSGISTGVLSIARFEGDLYIGTTNGLFRYNENRRLFEMVPGVPQSQVFTLLPDEKELLVGEDGFFGIRDKKAYTIRPSVSGDLTISAIYISQKHPDILLGGGPFGMAIFRKEKQSGKWEFKGYVPGITDQIWSIAENKDGTVWAGTATGLDYRTTIPFDANGNPDVKKSSFVKYGASDGYKNGTGTVFHINGINYFVADSTFYTFNNSQKRFIRDTTFGNFPNGGGATEIAMAEDQQGRVWIRFGKVTRLAIPKPGGGYRIESAHLNAINDHTIQSFYPEKDSILWICTTDGLIRFNEKLDRNSDESFQTILRHVTAGNKALNTDESENKKSISISFKNNTLRFEYAAPFFEHEEKTQYQTWLEGFEKSWSGFDNNYYKEYTNLSPGEYHFHVRAKNIYNKLSKEAVYDFVILPPWYGTWWAYLLYAVLAFVIIYMIISWRTRQLKAKHIELENTVKERTAQLSQRLAELSVINSVQGGLVAQMNMGEIYTLVGNRIRDLFDAQSVVIRTFDYENKTEIYNYGIEKGKTLKITPRLFDKFSEHLMQLKRPELINNRFSEYISLYSEEKNLEGEIPKSAVFVPMILGDRVIGNVSLQNVDHENAFSESDVNLLSTLVNSMSVALENARLFDETTRLLKETEQRTAELSIINSVQEGLAKELHMQAIYELVGDKLSEVMHTLDIDIRLFSPETNQVFYPYMRDHGERLVIPPGPLKGMSKYVYETRQTLIINEDLAGRMKELGSTLVPGTQMEKSYMAVPITVGSKVIGMVSISNYEKENAFSDSEIRLLQTVISAMSVALENARLFDETNRLLKETEQRTAELAVINSVQEGLVAQMDIQSIYDLVGEKIRNIFNAQIIDIVTYNKKTNLVEDRYAFEKGDRTLLGAREPLGFRKHVIENRQVFLINEKMDEASKKYDSYVTIGESPKSAVFVPMITGGEVTGVISLQNLDREHAFSEGDVNLLTTLANSMSVALKSAGLFDETNRLLKETEQRNAELAVINSVQESLVAKMDMAGIYELVGEKIREIFNAQVIDIVTYDSARNVIADRYAYEKGDRTLLGEREPNGFRKHVIKTGTLLLNNENVERAMREFKNEILIGEIPKSQIYVPMISDGKVKGIISLQNLDHEHAFSESDVNLLTTLSNSMSVALESARLFDETNRLLKETEQRTSELAVINSVQEGLVAQMDIQAIYDLVGEKIRNIFNAQIIDIVTYDKKNNLIEDKYSYEKGDRTLLGQRRPLGFRKHLIDSPQVFLINEKMGEVSKKYDSYVTIGEQPKSAVFVPMITGGQITGIISLQNLDHEFAFSESDVSLLTTLSNSMSVALQSAGLFDETNRLLKETEQRNAELAVINSVQESLVAKLDMAGIYELVGEKIREIFNAQVIDIVTYNPVRNVIVDKYSYEKGDRTLLGERKPSGFRKHVIETGSLLLHNENVERAMREFKNEILIGEVPKSQVYVPMIADGKVKGVISLQNLDHEHAFSESDVSLITTLANSMSVALESARLFDETNRLLNETEQRNSELAVINTVQESLVAKMDEEAIYFLVGEKIREIFNAQVIDITTYDSATNQIEDKYAYEKGDRTLMSSREPYGFRKHVIETGQMLVINRDMEKERKKYNNLIVVGKSAKSLIMAPLMTGGKVIGVISLQNLDIENAFSPSEISLLSTLINSMSVALKSARLFDETARLLKETEQRTAELAVINSVQEGLVREMNTQSIFDMVGDRICSLFPDSQTLIIRTFDTVSGLEHWQYALEKGERLKSNPRPMIWANKQLAITKKTFVINNHYLETARQYGGKGVSKGQPPKSAVFVPMIVGDEVKGSLSLQNLDYENAFNEADIRLLTTVTNSMSVAIENARLFDETNRLLADAKQRATELSTVNNISRALASQLNPSDLIQLVGDQLKELFNANVVYLALLDKKTGIIHFPYQFGDDMAPMNLGEGLTSNIILKGEPLLINKDLNEQTDHLGLQRIGIPAASYLGVPIPVGDEIIGVLSVQSTEQENRFNENDQRLLTTIASSVGVALKNAQLFEDVEQAKMEAEMATKNAEKANEAKSAFLSTVSHELRTPLTSVLGFAKIIRKRLEDKIFSILDKSDPKTSKTIDQINENLKVVISEGERLTHLINDVLDLAKIEAGKMEWNKEDVSLADVAERAIAATTSLFDQKPVKLIKKIEPDIPIITGDTDKLIQVVINLFSNAAKFTDKGTITCHVYKKSNEVLVSISDTGIGISSEDYGAVFEQFKQVGGDTLTDKPKGTGLGLPICKEIVEHHGGRIWVESKVGKGSTFSFAIPFKQVKVESSPIKKPIHLNDLVRQLKEQMDFSKLKLDGKNATILVVDDDDSIRSLLNQELSEAGYNIEQASDGKKALEAIRKNRPDLIILDVMMPEINGFDVAAILKNDPNTMDIPIIILSIVQDRARGFRIGVDRYLTKPIDTVKLFEEVGNLLVQGKSKKKVMVVDEDSSAIRSLTEVLSEKGYIVVESDGNELVEKAISTQPDIIILNSLFSDKNKIVQSLRFEKGLENVLFLIYQ